MASREHHSEFLESRARKGLFVTWVGLILNLVLTLFKFAAGILGRSSAMIADAVHSFSDLGTDILVIICFKFVGKDQDDVHRYGHGKIETVISGLIGLALLIVGLVMIYSSIVKVLACLSGEVLPRPGLIALIAAAVSIIVKELLFQYTMLIGKRIRSDAVKTNAWHHRSDALSSIGTFIGIGGAILLGGKWTVLDPIAAICVSLIIIWISIKFMRSSFTELTESSLDQGTEEKLVDILCSIEGVRGYHDLRTRKIGTEIAMDVHVTVDEGISIENAHDVADRIEAKVRECYGEGSIINIHIEPNTNERARRSIMVCERSGKG